MTIAARTHSPFVVCHVSQDENKPFEVWGVESDCDGAPYWVRLGVVADRDAAEAFIKHHAENPQVGRTIKGYFVEGGVKGNEWKDIG